MNHVPEQIIMAVASIINLALLIYAVDWRYFSRLGGYLSF